MEYNKKFLIVGAQSTPAKTLAFYLTERFSESLVICLDSRPIDEFMQHPRIKFIQTAYSIGQFNNLFANITFDAIFMVGKLINDIKNPGSITELDVGQIQIFRLLQLSQKSQVKKIIFLSSFNVYEGSKLQTSTGLSEEAPLHVQKDSPYYKRKMQEEDLYLSRWMNRNKATIEIIILRPSNIFGPHIKSGLQQLLLKNKTIIAHKNMPFQLLHEIDLASVMLESLSFPTGIYNVSSETTITLQEILQILDIKRWILPPQIGRWQHQAKLNFKTPLLWPNLQPFSLKIDSSKLDSVFPRKKLFRYSPTETLKSINIL